MSSGLAWPTSAIGRNADDSIEVWHFFPFQQLRIAPAICMKLIGESVIALSRYQLKC